MPVAEVRLSVNHGRPWKSSFLRCPNRSSRQCQNYRLRVVSLIFSTISMNVKKPLIGTCKKIGFGMICAVVLSGCATIKTLDDAHLPLNRRIFIYSGTRFDWAVLTENEVTLRKFHVDPLDYPLIDLPLSVALDSLFLPLTVCTEIFH